MSIVHRFLESSIQLHLANTFKVDVTRVEVRVSSGPIDPAVPAGRHLMRFEAELDGKTPPPEWGEVLQHILETCAMLATATGAGPIEVTSGTSEDAR